MFSIFRTVQTQTHTDSRTCTNRHTFTHKLTETS